MQNGMIIKQGQRIDDTKMEYIMTSFHAEVQYIQCRVWDTY